ncbi:uncharacterized protein LOC121862437 [Homarus americanus]|uniref:Collagen alpha-1(VI) chain-like n=1 Tax=Homarus americanus TaxID=6706 RepID=A0A8J5N2M7_HOMAM|nr:uncharacterized protein LOC121862437 [Homarus americanus]KAG7172091.1 Collagen alpha-1(VI) chain-like [Homarus americanus]
MLWVVVASVLLVVVPQRISSATSGTNNPDLSQLHKTPPPLEIRILDDALNSLKIPEARRLRHDYQRSSKDTQLDAEEVDEEDDDLVLGNFKTSPRFKRQYHPRQHSQFVNTRTQVHKQAIACPSVVPPSANISHWDHLKYVANAHVPGCVKSQCSHSCHRREPCAFDHETIMARLSLLEERLRGVTKIETRMKVHAALLLRVQTNPNFPGRRGDRGPQGPQGRKGMRGPLGSPGTPGSCTVSGSDSAPAGVEGPPGNKGYPGFIGDKLCGCNGDRGESGDPGKSQTGPPGPKGYKGAKGAKGPTPLPL